MEIGPAEFIFNWQSLILAAIISFTVTLIKQATNIFIKDDTKNKWQLLIIKFLIPSLPLLLGFVMGTFSGLQPDKLIEYVVLRNSKHINDIKHPWLIYAAWGSCIGIFSDYLYLRVKLFLGSAIGVKLLPTSRIVPTLKKP